MTKKLLLVDDEQFFLEGLQDGLSECRKIFTTDICFSVTDAITLLEKNNYDLVVSDIRMPEKSGLDLFLYLRETAFRGGFIAMTAFGTEEVINQIRRLGGLDVILKPFNFTWFKDKILDYFKEEGEGVSGIIDSIDLTSLLQMINLERKSLTVKIECKMSEGFLYFSKGEMVHAQYQDLSSEEAAFQLIKMNRGRFSLQKPEKKVPHTIEVPFLTLMINIMKRIDDESKALTYEKKNQEKKMDIKKLNEGVKYLKEQLGDGLLHTDLWAAADGQSLAAYNPQPKAVALFNHVTNQLAGALNEAEEDFVRLGRYYLVDLIGDHMVMIIYLGDYQWGILFNKKLVQLGLLLNVIVPKLIDIFEEAVTN